MSRRGSDPVGAIGVIFGFMLWILFVLGINLAWIAALVWIVVVVLRATGVIN